MDPHHNQRQPYAANTHINHLMPFSGKATFMGPDTPSTGPRSSIHTCPLSGSSRPVSQQSSPFAHPHASQQSPFIADSGISSVGGYKTARAILPTGVNIPLSSTSSGPFFEDTMADMLNCISGHGVIEENKAVAETSSPAGSCGEGERTSEESADGQEEPQEKDAPPEVFGETLDQVVSKIFDEEQGPDPHILRSCRFKVIGVLVTLVLLIASCIVLSSFPVSTCNDTEGLCLAPVSIRLTDKTESAKTTMQTIREALKVLTYIVIDFGDAAGDSELMNNRMDDYYQTNVIDSFNVNTTYDLNVWGYCRTSGNGDRFCMKSYGFDIISVFVRDAGVQLGELTKTNVGIMGDSFAMLYELTIAGFSELLLREEGSGNGEYVDHAILLQKFSKGMGFTSITQLAVNCFLLFGALLLLVLIFNSSERPSSDGKIYALKKYTVVTLTLLSFVGVLSGFIVLSFTQQFYVKLEQLTTAIGIADVETNAGFHLLWILFVAQVSVAVLVVYIANTFRKRLF